MIKTKNQQQGGDTLIEVLLVTAIISMIAVGGTLLMNRAMSGTQTALEQTVVRQAVEGEVEMLTFARDQSINAPASPAAGVWGQVLAQASSSVSAYGNCLSGSGPHRFFLTMNGGTNLTFNSTPAPATAVASIGKGVWVEAYRPSASADYIDAHVYACWESPTDAPNLTTGTVVRLYVP